MSRTHLGALAFLAVLTLSPIAATAQQPAEAQRLGVYAGEWTYDNMPGGTTCDWLGERIMTCKSTWTPSSGVEQAQVFIIRWDSGKSVYTVHRFNKSGYADSGFGWFSGDAWSLVFEGDLGVRMKVAGTIDSKSWKYAWYRSREGGDWEKTSESSLTKVARDGH